MRLCEQVFCKCGKGRSFIQSTGTKAECAEYKREWLEGLEEDGWEGVDVPKGRAAKCNQCKAAGAKVSVAGQQQE